MKRIWAYVCATNDTNSKTLRGYCRTLFQCGYVPICPRLQDGQFIVLENPDERHAFNEIVRDKLLRCTVLVVCGKHSDATTNAEVGLAKKYSKVLTTLDGVLQAAEKGEVLSIERVNAFVKWKIPDADKR